MPGHRCRNKGMDTGGRASLGAQVVKNLPAIQEIQVRSPGGEDALEKGMATHSSIPAWSYISRTEETGGLQSMGSQKSDTTERLTLFFPPRGERGRVGMNWEIRTDIYTILILCVE